MSKDYTLIDLSASCTRAADLLRASDYSAHCVDTVHHLLATHDRLHRQADTIRELSMELADVTRELHGEKNRSRVALQDRLRAVAEQGQDDALAECNLCGAPVSVMDQGWRWNGESWAHNCPGSDPQVGHVGRAVPRKFAAWSEGDKVLHRTDDGRVRSRCRHCGAGGTAPGWHHSELDSGAVVWRHDCRSLREFLAEPGAELATETGFEVASDDEDPSLLKPGDAVYIREDGKITSEPVPRETPGTASAADLMPIVYALGIAEDPDYASGPIWTALRLLAPDLYAECDVDANAALDRWMAAHEEEAVAAGFRDPSMTPDEEASDRSTRRWIASHREGHSLGRQGDLDGRRSQVHEFPEESPGEVPLRTLDPSMTPDEEASDRVQRPALGLPTGTLGNCDKCELGFLQDAAWRWSWGPEGWVHECPVDETKNDE